VAIKHKAKNAFHDFYFDECDDIFNLPNVHHSLNDINVGIQRVCNKIEELKDVKMKRCELEEVLRRVKNKALLANLNQNLTNEVKHFQDRVDNLVEKNLFLGSKPELSISSIRNLYNIGRLISIDSTAYDYNHIFKAHITLQDQLLNKNSISFYCKHFDKYTKLERLQSLNIDFSHSKMTTDTCVLL